MTKFMMILNLLLFLSCFVAISQAQLKFGFYARTCPSAESVVRSVVNDAVRNNANMAAVLLRLHFHDCFVEGCDGSILIDGPNAEKHAFGHQGVGGFEVIERAKGALEARCPGVVSCADIVTMAARDAVVMANGPEYEVLTGRRDGRVSDVSLADELPDVSDSVQVLKNKFGQKGMTDKDLVLLSAAHTIGTTACFFMTKRLYDFFPGGGSDPDISPTLLPELKSQCPRNGDVNVRLGIDHGSPRTFDVHILQNIRDGFAVLASDARLNDDASTRAVIDSYFSPLAPILGPSFQEDFVNSMVRMGQIGTKTGSQGEIRRVCSAFN
uniref:Peroxidase n=1 Tax=Luffa aegyptiaca TaxID=3670 RepID=A0A1L5JHU5_LUFAE|nr:peroxidase 6 [Luffa aegyptiaca]